ncbi:hypothetical protein P4S72_00585 [Vibrio sp. PP-XX7]
MFPKIRRDSRQRDISRINQGQPVEITKLRLLLLHIDRDNPNPLIREPCQIRYSVKMACLDTGSNPIVDVIDTITVVYF